MLQHARTIVEAGWVQNRWTVPAAASASACDDPDRRSGCVPAWSGPSRWPCAPTTRADLAVSTGPALAYVCDAVFGGDSRPVGPAPLRAARRELAR